MNETDKSVFGGETSCYLVETEGMTLFLDAGTGIMTVPEQAMAAKKIKIFLSHTHIDHILGLPFFPGLFKQDVSLDIYVKKRNGLSAAEQLGRLFSPPLWPAGLASYPAETVCHDLELPMKLGPLTVSGIESFHPNGSTVFRLDCCGKSLVYATDFEHSEAKLTELACLAQGCGLLLYDGQYTPEEYERHKGFGHSTPETGLRVFRESGAGRMLIIHHDPRHSDETLSRMEASLGEPAVRFARKGEVVCL